MFRRCSSVSGYSNVETKRAFTCVLQLVSHIWQNQRRWLQLGRATATSADKVSASLPQGDALSPLALVLLLADTTAKVEAVQNVTSSMYVDDRAICSSDARQLQHCIQMWRDTSRALGLKENEAKTNYVCFTAAQNQSLEREGVDPKCVIEQIRVLESLVLMSFRPRGMNRKLC